MTRVERRSSASFKLARAAEHAAKAAKEMAEAGRLWAEVAEMLIAAEGVADDEPAPPVPEIVKERAKRALRRIGVKA